MASGSTPRPGTKAGPAQGWILLVTMTLPVMGVVLLAPTLPLLNEHFAGHPYLVSIALTAPALCIALFSPMAGYLADRFQRRTVLLYALAFYGAFGIWPVFIDSILIVVLARFGLGIAEATIMTSCFALLADYFATSERDRWLAYLASFIALAATAFYVMGGYLGTLSWRAPFAAYGASELILLAALMVLFEPDRSVTSTARADAKLPESRTFIDRRLLGTLAVTTVASILFFIVPLQFSVLLNEIGAQSSLAMGVLLACAGFGNPLGALVFRWTARFGTALNLVFAFAFSGVGLLLAASSRDPIFATGAAFVNQLGAGLTYPVLMASAMNQLPPNLRGRGGGMWLSAFFVGQFVSPLVVVRWAAVSSHVSTAFAGLGAVCLVAAAAALGSLIATNRIVRRSRA
jgi:MFS family permease